MKPENKQRFYSVNTQSEQLLSWSALPFMLKLLPLMESKITTTENQPTIQATGESSPQASEEKTWN